MTKHQESAPEPDPIDVANEYAHNQHGKIIERFDVPADVRLPPAIRQQAAAALNAIMESAWGLTGEDVDGVTKHSHYWVMASQTLWPSHQHEDGHLCHGEVESITMSNMDEETQVDALRETADHIEETLGDKNRVLNLSMLGELFPGERFDVVVNNYTGVIGVVSIKSADDDDDETETQGDDDGDE